MNKLHNYGLIRFSKKTGKVDTSMTAIGKGVIQLWALQNTTKTKACGCRWSSTKKLWSWHFQEDGMKWHKGSKTMAQIRSKYGSTTFTRGAAAGSDALPA